MRFDWRTSVLIALGALTSSVSAQNAVTGRQLYLSTNGAPLSCGSPGPTCHGVDPTLNVNNVRKGTTATVILNALNNVPVMNFLRNAPYTVTTQNAADIAAYIVNPAAATAPSITLSATALTFASTLVGNTNAVSSPTSITLTNSGVSTLTITGINRTGTNAAEFAVGGTCVGASVAPAGTCTISGTFTPTAAGSRTASFTVQSNAASNPSITVTGTASATPMPALTRSATTLAFNAQTLGTTSAVLAIAITNTGTAPLNITQVSATPVAEFALTTDCVATWAPNGQCTINVTFAPSAVGARSGAVSIVSNATGSPHAVTLAGTGVLAPTPIASLSAATLSFSTVATGQSATQSTTLTNTGNAQLMIANTSIAGQNAAEFRVGTGTTCAAGALAPSSSCRLEVTFLPQTVGGKVATATVAHNASASSSAVALAGAATAPPSPTVSASPSSSAMAPSNLGGGGGLEWYLAGLLLLATGVSPRIRRRL